tara:strand:+ start:163 stop:1344 length:1182 start_codon:yes stop_codon:yes gene_type:complete
MNIIILSDRYHPTPVSGAVLIYDLARELVEQNHNVYVLTADSKLDSKHTLTLEEGVNVLRVKAQNQKELSKPYRLLFELLLQRRIWNAFQVNNLDIEFNLLIAHSPTIFWSFIIRKLTKKFDNLSKYLILRDIFPKWALDTGIISKYNPIYWFLKWHEKKLYKGIKTIGVQSKSNLAYFGEDHTPARIEVLYNFKRIESTVLKESNIRKELKIYNKVIYVFGGNLGFAQDVDNLLRLVYKSRRNEKIHFLFIGEGTEYTKIKYWIEKNNISNLNLLPAVTDIEYQSILKECDVGIISLRSTFRTDNFPNKIMNYMQYELPILASINSGSELGVLITENNIGLVSTNGDDEKFLSNAENLLDEEKRIEMGVKGKELLQKQFNVQSAARKILDSM